MTITNIIMLNSQDTDMVKKIEITIRKTGPLGNGRRKKSN